MIVRTVAGWNHDKAQAVLDWPLREVLLAYLQRLKNDALASYRHNYLVWSSRTAMGAKIKPPEIPDILKEKRVGTKRESANVSTCN